MFFLGFGFFTEQVFLFSETKTQKVAFLNIWGAFSVQEHEHSASNHDANQEDYDGAIKPDGMSGISLDLSMAYRKTV